MTDITWVKLLTNIRNNKKIRLIKQMPEGDALFCIWIDFICLAGEVNDGGYIYIEPGIPYSTEELATVLERPANVMRLALTTFDHYQMISREEKGIFLNSFAEIQNVEGMERVRELNRNRAKRYRALQKNKEQKLLSESSVTLPVTLRHSTDKIRIDKNIREEKNINYKKVWDDVLLILKTQMNKTNFEYWLKDTEGGMVEDGCFYILVNTQEVSDFIEQSQKSLISNALTKITGTVLDPVCVLKEGANDRNS